LQFELGAAAVGEIRARTATAAPGRRRTEMASSDQMTRLAERAKQAEEHTADTRERARADLEQDIASARASAEAGADRLRERADATETNLSDWWTDVQQSWDRHVTMVRKHIDERKAEHDRDRAETDAKIAEDDAQFAIDYAYAAIEEAEYAVLDAALARMEADELAAGSKA
jgi:hypothetical protein